MNGQGRLQTQSPFKQLPAGITLAWPRRNNKRFQANKICKVSQARPLVYLPVSPDSTLHATLIDVANMLPDTENLGIHTSAPQSSSEPPTWCALAQMPPTQ